MVSDGFPLAATMLAMNSFGSFADFDVGSRSGLPPKAHFSSVRLDARQVLKVGRRIRKEKLAS
jgi:hypothetical protein